MTTLQAGAAQLDITPLIGTTMPTLFNPRTSTGIHDALHSKALVLKSGDMTLAMACLDQLCVAAADVQAAREIVEERCGIPGDHVLISATHTHSTAGPGGDFGVDLKPPEYHEWLTHRVADSVTMAHHRLQPAQLGHGVGSLPQHVHNRRYYMKDGSAATNPGRQNPEVVKPAGPTDPDIALLVVLDEQSNPIAAVGNYALHYVGGTGGPEFSADYYGAVSRLLNLSRAAEFPVLWTNGCSGDINNIDVFGKTEKQQPYEQIERVASEAVEEADRVWNGLELTNEVALAARVSRFTVPLRRPTDAALARAKELYAQEDAAMTRDWVLAKEMVQTSQMPSPEPTEVQALRIGDLAVVALPGEIFCQFGLDIKDRSPFSTTMPIGLANGYIGYIPTTDSFTEGGYETLIARSSRCAPEVGPLLVEQAVGLLDDLKGSF